MVDAIAHILMDPRVSLRCVAWWIRVHLGALGLEDYRNSKNGEIVSEHSEDDDPY